MSASWAASILVVVFKREIGQLLVRFVKLRIQIGGLLSRFHGVLAETLRFNLRDAEIGSSVVLVDLERFFEETVRFLTIEALEKQVAPADAVVGVLGILLDQIAKLVVGFLVTFDAPESFGAQIWIGAGGQLGVASSAPRRVFRDDEARGIRRAFGHPVGWQVVAPLVIQR